MQNNVRDRFIWHNGLSIYATHVHSQQACCTRSFVLNLFTLVEEYLYAHHPFNWVDLYSTQPQNTLGYIYQDFSLESTDGNG